MRRVCPLALVLALGCGDGGGEGEGEPACDLLAQDCPGGEACFVEPDGVPFCAKPGELGTSGICVDDQLICAAGFYCTPGRFACCPFCADGAPDSACPQGKDVGPHVCCPRDDLPDGVSLCLPEPIGCAS